MLLSALLQCLNQLVLDLYVTYSTNKMCNKNGDCSFLPSWIKVLHVSNCWSHTVENRSLSLNQASSRWNTSAMWHCLLNGHNVTTHHVVTRFIFSFVGWFPAYIKGYLYLYMYMICIWHTSVLDSMWSTVWNMKYFNSRWKKTTITIFITSQF
jgi:hypothetical protein